MKYSFPAVQTNIKKKEKLIKFQKSFIRNDYLSHGATRYENGEQTIN